MNLNVRELGPDEVDWVIDYFLTAKSDYLKGMGVMREKLPSKERWRELLHEDFTRAKEDREFYYLLWLQAGKPIGHSNLTKIVFGEQAFMHLHLWDSIKRRSGCGTQLLTRSLPYYFNEFNLNSLFCEPYALNPAPNRTLKRAGFQFIKRYETVPGWINCYQPVNRWCLSRERFIGLTA